MVETKTLKQIWVVLLVINIIITISVAYDLKEAKKTLDQSKKLLGDIEEMKMLWAKKIYPGDGNINRTSTWTFISYPQVPSGKIRPGSFTIFYQSENKTLDQICSDPVNYTCWYGGGSQEVQLIEKHMRINTSGRYIITIYDPETNRKYSISSDLSTNLNGSVILNRTIQIGKGEWS